MSPDAIKARAISFLSDTPSPWHNFGFSDASQEIAEKSLQERTYQSRNHEMEFEAREELRSTPWLPGPTKTTSEGACGPNEWKGVMSTLTPYPFTGGD
jgi:hypothetical protein